MGLPRHQYSKAGSNSASGGHLWLRARESVAAKCNTFLPLSPLYAAPGRVERTRVRLLGADRAQLEWTAPASPRSSLVGYEVRCTSDAGMMSNLTVRNSIELVDLTPVTSYTVMVSWRRRRCCCCCCWSCHLVVVVTVVVVVGCGSWRRMLIVLRH